MRCRSFLSLAGLALLAGCAGTPMGGAGQPQLPLHAQTYAGPAARDPHTLLVVLNGDGTAASRSDHYRFAQAASHAIAGSVAVAMLRPGYADAAGNRSPGDRGTDTGDNYTPERLDVIADAIARLRRRYPDAQLILVGESGGAAMAADLAGIRPELIDGMVLVGCPCALPEWRMAMRKQTANAGWSAPVASLDPLKTAGGVGAGLRAAILVGADDRITPPTLSRSYAEALALRGIATDLRIVPGRGHDLLNDPEVLAATVRLAGALPKKG